MRGFIFGFLILVLGAGVTEATELSSREILVKPSSGMPVQLRVLSSRSVRIQRIPEGADSRESLVMLNDLWDADAPIEIQENETLTTLKTSNMQVTVRTDNGLVTISRADGSEILREKTTTYLPLDDSAYHTSAVQWICGPEDAFYGLGQLQQGLLDLNGQRVELKQDNTEAVTPYVSSSGGYSIYWDQYGHSVFDAQVDGEVLFATELGDAIDYVVCVDDSFDVRIAEYRKMTGAAPLFPKWAYGYQQCRERYKTQQEVVDIVREFRKREFPLDLIIQDWKYWGDEMNVWSGMMFDPERYPDPSGLTKAVHDLNAKIMIVVWPFVGEASKVKADLEEAGGLVGRGTDFLKKSYLYDAYSDEARAIYLTHAKKTMIDHDFDAWWVDGCEPENFFSGPTALGPMERVRNAFVLEHAKGLYGLQRETMPDKRVYSLARSGFAGVQRYGVATWSGDIDASWDVMAKQVTAGLGYSMSGLPYWTMDIGAFTAKAYPEGCKDPAYRELYTRWFQFGAFCPLFRSHGTDTPREPWQFGEPGEPYYNTLLKFTQLRYRLLPYIYSLAGMVTLNHYTMMRAMPMDFSDEWLADCTDQFMFGPAFLVAPVLEAQRPENPEGAKRHVRLPFVEGGWIDFWNGEPVDGGAGLDLTVPLHQMPLYVRAGSIVPMGPVMEYTDQFINPPIELRIYPGADASFMYYQDAGDGYGYEQGEYSRIPMQWDDESGSLTLGAREGTFEGMSKKICFLPVRVQAGKGGGLEDPTATGCVIRYRGEEIKVKIK